MCKAWIGCILPIYMYIDQYRGLYAKRSQYIYIYIYIHMLESWRTRLNLALAAQNSYR